MRFFFLAFILISITCSTFGQNPTANVAPNWTVESLITDRPDQTESSITVPRGALQIETGLIFENYSGKGFNLENFSLGTTLFRYGIRNNFELRLGSSYQISTLKPGSGMSDTTQQGMSPISGGIKVFIAEEKGPWPELALLADLTINQVTTLDFRPTYNYSTIRFAASHTLSDRYSLGYNLGYANNGEDPKGYFIYTVVLGMRVSEKIGAFLEAYGNFDPAGIPRHRIDGGFTWLINHNLQFDLSGGYGPEDDGVSMWFVSTGISWRIPD